jgi:hypothetical protein
MEASNCAAGSGRTGRKNARRLSKRSPTGPRARLPALARLRGCTKMFGMHKRYATAALVVLAIILVLAFVRF